MLEIDIEKRIVNGAWEGYIGRVNRQSIRVFTGKRMSGVELTNFFASGSLDNTKLKVYGPDGPIYLTYESIDISSPGSVAAYSPRVFVEERTLERFIDNFDQYVEGSSGVAKAAAQEALDAKDQLTTDVGQAINELNEVKESNRKRYLDPVATVAERDSAYPTPQNGDSVWVSGEGKMYRYNGTEWKVTNENDPSAIDMVNQQLADKVNKRNAPMPIAVMNAYQTNENVHPSVKYVPNGFLGFKYWMGFTPYTLTNNTQENPSIRASEDGKTWVQVSDVPDPLIARPSGTGSFNSDIDIVIYNNEFYVFWRSTPLGVAANSYISYIKSSNLLTWTSPVVLSTLPAGCVSPSFYRDGDLWHCWFVDMLDGNKLKHYQSADLLGLAEVGPVSFSIPGYVNWHPEVQRINGMYECLMSAYPSNKSNAYCELFFATSADGVNFSVRSAPILTPSTYGWDNRSIYKASFLREATDRYKIWYSAANIEGRWGIGLTGGSIDNLQGTVPDDPNIFGALSVKDFLRVDKEIRANIIKAIGNAESLKLLYGVGNQIEFYGGTSRSTDTPNIIIDKNGSLKMQGSGYHIEGISQYLHIRGRATDGTVTFNRGQGKDVQFFGGGTTPLTQINKEGDIEFKQDTTGIIFKNGTKRFRMTVDNNGVPVFTQI